MIKFIISMLFLFLHSNSYASQNVHIVWPFASGSNQANALRLIIENANQSQKKYNFIFEHKPGAGGTIAVNYVLNRKIPTLLLTTTSFFTRPIFYPNESYDVNKIQPIAIVSVDGPLVFLSKKFSNLNELKDQKNVTVGVISGSITELVARTIQKSINTNLTIVTYSSTIDATKDMIGNHIDVSVEFIRDALVWVDNGHAKILGITGNKDIDNHKTFMSQNVKNTSELVHHTMIVTNKEISDEFVQEMHLILTDAMLKSNVVEIWKNDRAIVTKRSYEDTLKFWNSQKILWNKITK